MTEHLMPGQNSKDFKEKTKSRNKRIALFLTGASFVAITALEKIGLEGGWHIFPSKAAAIERTCQDLTDPSNGNAYLNTESVFTKDNRNRNFDWVHRVNNLSLMDKAIEENKNSNNILVLEADTSIIDGEICLVHGLTMKDPLGFLFKIVIDPTEGQISKENPLKLSDALKHLQSLSTNEKPILLNLELKHGKYTREVFEKMESEILQYNSHVIVQPDQQGSRQRLDTMRIVYQEKTGLPGTPPYQW